MIEDLVHGGRVCHRRRRSRPPAIPTAEEAVDERPTAPDHLWILCSRASLCFIGYRRNRLLAWVQWEPFLFVLAEEPFAIGASTAHRAQLGDLLEDGPERGLEAMIRPVLVEDGHAFPVALVRVRDAFER